MAPEPRVAFFDHLAEHWDGWEDLATLPGRLDGALRGFGVAPGERVLEVGCGTGNLTLALTRCLGAEGRVFAVDCSPNMLARARAKVQDPRVTWIQAAVQELPPEPGELDRAILMGVWPHLDAKDQVLDLLHRRLRPGAGLHIWHLASRRQINATHAKAHAAVAQDVLEPALELAARLEAHGFAVTAALDDETQHSVSARRA